LAWAAQGQQDPLVEPESVAMFDLVGQQRHEAERAHASQQQDRP
jgi:hypothetical protein